MKAARVTAVKPIKSIDCLIKKAIACLCGAVLTVSPAGAFQATYNSPLINASRLPITTASSGQSQDNQGSEMSHIMLAIFSGLMPDTEAAKTIEKTNGQPIIASRCLLYSNRVALMNPVLHRSGLTTDSPAVSVDSDQIQRSGNLLFRLTPVTDCEGLSGIKLCSPDRASDSQPSFTSSILTAAYSAIRVGKACSGNCPNLWLVSSLDSFKPSTIPFVFRR